MGPKPILTVTITSIETTSAQVSWTYYSDSTFDDIFVKVKHNKAGVRDANQLATFTRTSNTTSHIFKDLKAGNVYTVSITTKKTAVESTEKTKDFITQLQAGKITTFDHNTMDYCITLYCIISEI